MKKLSGYILIFLIAVLFVSIPVVLFREDDNTNTLNQSQSQNPSSDKTEIIDFSSLTYFAFGDSITYGSDCSHALAQMENPYPVLVAEELGLKSHTNYGIVASTIATGVVNSNNYTLPSMYDCVVSAKTGADIVSIMGGVNDYNTNVELGTIEDVSTTTFYGSLNAICKVLKSKYPNAFIFFMTPYKEYPYQQKTCDTKNEKGYVLEDYANAIKDVCSIYDIPVLDMYTYGNFDLEFSASGSDGIHPSQEFVINYTTPQIVRFIKKNYK